MRDFSWSAGRGASACTAPVQYQALRRKGLGRGRSRRHRRPSAPALSARGAACVPARHRAAGALGDEAVDLVAAAVPCLDHALVDFGAQGRPQRGAARAYSCDARLTTTEAIVSTGRPARKLPLTVDCSWPTADPHERQLPALVSRWDTRFTSRATRALPTMLPTAGWTVPPPVTGFHPAGRNHDIASIRWGCPTHCIRESCRNRPALVLMLMWVARHGS